VGTLILAYAPLRDMLDIKIFLDTDEDVRLSRLVYKEVYNNHKNVADPIK
jgi:uridine kinase